MKKQKNKQAIKASKLAKAENKLKKQAEQIITVKNAEGDPDTQAKILIQNKINYTPKVSVIIPVYNVEAYLRECLDSVINQTLKEIEIICVDDGSTDNSLEILKEYAKKDNRISVLTQENSENMYTKACKYNVNICGGSLNQLKEGKIITDPKLIEDGYTFATEGIISYKDYQFDYGYWRFIYKRQFLRENQLYFPDYLRGQDPPFFIKAMAIAQQFYALAEATYVYRVSYKKIQWTKRKVQDVAKGLMDCLNLAETQNYDELYFRLSKRAINPYISNIFKLFIEEEDTKKLLCCMINNLNYHKIYMINPNYQLPDFYQQFLETKKVSIIIPVYNTASYLRECLDSVINQTLKEIEIICVNDGSTDNSLDILKEYAAKDKRIKIINQKNGGLGNARNNGVKEAIAPYIFFVDSDDWLDLTCLEKLFNKIISTKTDMCIYGLQKYDEINDRYIVDKYFDISCYDMRRNDVCDYKEISSVVFRRFGAVMKLYNKNFFMNNKLFFEEKVLFEDVFTHVKAILQAKKISFINENLYFYRVNRIGSIMNISRGEKNIFDIFTAIECVEKFLIDKNIDKFLQKEYISFVDEQIAFHQKRIIDIKLKREFNKKIMEFKEKSHLYHKVSIIIPVYNTAEFLPQCLDSVINQTLKEIEIICVDDGSTDNSLEILKEYAKKDERIIVITQKNQKQGAARNKGLSIAKGEYIQFVDSDDYILPNTCEELYKKCTNLNLDMLMFAGENFNSQTQKKEYTPYYNFQYLPKNWSKEIFSYKDCSPFSFQMACSAALTVYKRYFLVNNDIKFPEKVYFEDNLFFIKSLFNAQRISIDKTQYYKRRIHDNSTTQNWNRHFSDYLKIIDEVLQYLKNIKIENKIYLNYETSYLNVAINIYNKFKSKDKFRYYKQIKWLVEKYDMSKLTNIKCTSPAKANINFLYNLYKIKFLYRTDVLLKLQSARIDIKNFGNENNAVEITTSAKVSQPMWFTNEQGQGQVVESSKKIQNITIKAIQDGKLVLSFKGQDKRFEGIRFPLWVDYKSIKINGKEQLTAPVATWHDKPYRFEMPVKDGQVVTVEVVQQYHQYTKDELQDMILKLNPNSDYIRQNINRLTDKIYDKITVKPAAPRVKKPKAASNQELLASIAALNARIERLEQENRDRQAQLLAAINTLKKS